MIKNSWENKYVRSEVAGGGRIASVCIIHVDTGDTLLRFDFPEGRLVDLLANAIANILDKTSRYTSAGTRQRPAADAYRFRISRRRMVDGMFKV
jgi:hypothetical protein